MGVCFEHFGFDEISTPVMRTMLTMVNVVQIIISDFAHTVYIRFKAFWNFSKLLFVLQILAFRKFYSADVHHANYLESCSNHHFWHWAHCVYQIYSVLKLFEKSVCFANFGFYEISTPVMPTTLSMANIVYIIISNIANIVCITFKIFLNLFEMGVCFAHFGFDEISTPVMRTMLNMVNVGQINISDFACAHCVYQIYSVLKSFEIAVCFPHFGFYKISTPVMPTTLSMANIV